MLAHCPNCNVTVDCEESGNFLRPGDPFADKYSLLKCVKCFEPILVLQHEYVEYGDVGFGEAFVLFPIKDHHVNPAIPELLRKALFESILSLRGGAYTATVVMCRRTLEGFAKLNGVEEYNLKEAILQLSKKGIINTQLCEWADELRLSGNEAAHNITTEFSSMDARDILDFTIAILDFTYSYKVKFQEFKERKKKINSN
jgi:uncharacterized protein DUF4145